MSKKSLTLWKYALAGTVSVLLPITALALGTSSVELEFDTPTYLFIDDESQTGLDLSAELTIEMWFKLESEPLGADAYQLISKRHSSGQRSYALELQPTGHPNGKGIGFYTWSNGVDSACATFLDWEYQEGTWYHVAVTKSGTHVLFYVNGSQIGSVQICDNANIFEGAAEVRVGADDDANTKYDGLIDELRVWGVARIPREISGRYRHELPKGDKVGLRAYWKFDGDYADSSGNGNNLSQIGANPFSEDVPSFACLKPSAENIKKCSLVL